MRQMTSRMAFIMLAGGLMSAAVNLPALAQQSAKPLPVDRVILSTAGLAHIEHVMNVSGTEKVSVPVRLNQVDDVMKSLVIFDAKGSLGAVTLPGKQPLAEAFRDLPFTRDALTNPILLLNAYQGAAVTLTVGGSVVAGTLVSVTAEQIVHEGGISETRHCITLMTADGIKRLWMDEAQSLQFADTAIKDEIAKALSAVRQNATADQRALDITLKGEGSRAVRLGYVIEAPLWKAAYRLVLPAANAKDAQGLLQGWAVVENMTASDWDKVDLTLVSGNPVTFRQQLYQSYHVDRPEIPVEVLGRVMPRTDSGSVGTAAAVEEEAMMKQKSARMMAAPAAPAPMMAMESMAMADNAVGGAMAGYAGMVDGSAQTLAMGATAAASAEATTQVLFHFGDRIDLPSGQSLLMPFTSSKLAMTRLSLYQPDTHARHPLAAVELVNAADSGLPPGVLTIYEESDALKGTAFVGDARLPALAAGEKRMVSYALDSKVTVDRTTESDSTVGKVSIASGVIRAAQTVREKTTYAIAAPAKEARRVVIEHPRRGDFTLVTPKAEDVEVTDGYYRIAVDVAAGEKKKIDVVLENMVWQSYTVENFSLDDLLAYASNRGEMDDDTRELFADLAKTRREVDGLDGKIAQLNAEREMIFADQTRLRDNLRSLNGTSDIQQRYLKKLGEQETRIADIDDELVKLQRQRAELQEVMKKKIADVQDSE